MRTWLELTYTEREALINENIFSNEPYVFLYSDDRKYELLELVVERMEKLDCPFIELTWMHPRRNPGPKQFGAKFWCKKLSTESWGFADNPVDAMLEAAVLAALGRLNLG